MSGSDEASERWRAVLTGEDPNILGLRGRYKRIPSDPRCKLCNSPFGGIGGWYFRRTGRAPWARNPRFCTACFLGVQRLPGGAEVEIMLLFADVRGSTPLSERLGAREFSKLINRFFTVGSHALIDSDGFIEKYVGDEVAGVYLPGWSGPDFASKALGAGLRILRDTGNVGDTTPWVPVGIGLHYGTAYVGTIGSADGVADFGVLGDAPNLAARLASAAKAGEILVSDAAAAVIGAVADQGERRELALKGITEPVRARALRA